MLRARPLARSRDSATLGAMKNKKRSIRGKQLDAGWDNACLLKILGIEISPV